MSQWTYCLHSPFTLSSPPCLLYSLFFRDCFFAILFCAMRSAVLKCGVMCTSTNTQELIFSLSHSTSHISPHIIRSLFTSSLHPYSLHSFTHFLLSSLLPPPTITLFPSSTTHHRSAPLQRHCPQQRRTLCGSNT